MLMMSCLISIVYSLYKKWKSLLGINYYKLYWYKEHDKIGNGMSNSVQKLKKKNKNCSGHLHRNHGTYY